MKLSVESEAKKIAIVGPSSAGKSTMTGIMREKFRDVPSVSVLGEGAELFFKENKSIDTKTLYTVGMQREIQDFVLQHELAAYQPGIELIITDRSVVDPIIYTHPDKAGVRELTENVAPWLSTYSMFTILDPKGVPYEQGPYRRETPEYRLEVPETFKHFFAELGLPYRVISGPLDERVTQMNDVIREVAGERILFDSALGKIPRNGPLQNL